MLPKPRELATKDPVTDSHQHNTPAPNEHDITAEHIKTTPRNINGMT